jgi:hypothetical protein
MMPGPAITFTKYVELIKNKNLAAPLTPFGPGYDVLFDEKVPVAGWKEIRVWVHVFVDNYMATPVTAATRLELRFMHDFAGSNSFDYEVAELPYNHVTSYINGYSIQPLLGKEVRLLCHPVDLPPGPYELSVTYLLVR